jgi:hypothetical protein
MRRGIPAVCVVATCTLCRRAFNPLGGPCGCVLCPHCLREYVPSNTVNCSACGPAQRGMCLVRHAAVEDQRREKVQAAAVGRIA